MEIAIMNAVISPSCLYALAMVYPDNDVSPQDARP